MSHQKGQKRRGRFYEGHVVALNTSDLVLAQEMYENCSLIKTCVDYITQKVLRGGLQIKLSHGRTLSSMYYQQLQRGFLTTSTSMLKSFLLYGIAPVYISPDPLLLGQPRVFNLQSLRVYKITYDGEVTYQATSLDHADKNLVFYVTHEPTDTGRLTSPVAGLIKDFLWYMEIAQIHNETLVQSTIQTYFLTKEKTQISPEEQGVIDAHRALQVNGDESTACMRGDQLVGFGQTVPPIGHVGGVDSQFSVMGRRPPVAAATNRKNSIRLKSKLCAVDSGYISHRQFINVDEGHKITCTTDGRNLPNVLPYANHFESRVFSTFHIPPSMLSTQGRHFKSDGNVHAKELRETLQWWGKQLSDALNDACVRIYGIYQSFPPTSTSMPDSGRSSPPASQYCTRTMQQDLHIRSFLHEERKPLFRPIAKRPRRSSSTSKATTPASDLYNPEAIFAKLRRPLLCNNAGVDSRDHVDVSTNGHRRCHVGSAPQKSTSDYMRMDSRNDPEQCASTLRKTKDQCAVFVQTHRKHLSNNWTYADLGITEYTIRGVWFQVATLHDLHHELPDPPPPSLQLAYSTPPVDDVDVGGGGEQGHPMGMKEVCGEVVHSTTSTGTTGTAGVATTSTTGTVSTTTCTTTGTASVATTSTTGTMSTTTRTTTGTVSTTTTNTMGTVSTTTTNTMGTTRATTIQLGPYVENILPKRLAPETPQRYGRQMCNRQKKTTDADSTRRPLGGQGRQLARPLKGASAHNSQLRTVDNSSTVCGSYYLQAHMQCNDPAGVIQSPAFQTAGEKLKKLVLRPIYNLREQKIQERWQMDFVTMMCEVQPPTVDTCGTSLASCKVDFKVNDGTKQQPNVSVEVVSLQSISSIEKVLDLELEIKTVKLQRELYNLKRAHHEANSTK